MNTEQLRAAWRKASQEYYRKKQAADPQFAAKKSAGWRKANPERSLFLERHRKFTPQQRAHRNVRCRQRYKENITYKVALKLRNRINDVLKDRRKSASALHLLGCSVCEFKRRMESLFTQGMSWENYGEWEIDHIRPCASFDLALAEEQKRCFHFSNMQPLWKSDNRSKWYHAL